MLAGEPVFVTGATGFIGSRLRRRLVAEGAEVHVLVRPGRVRDRRAVDRSVRVYAGDITDADSVRAALNAAGARVVYHLAADTAVRHVDGALSGVDASVAVNLQGTLNVIQAAHAASAPVARLIRLGGIEEYGHGPSPFEETQRERPVSPYSASQVAATHYSQMLQPYVGFDIVTLRPALVYGPGQSAGFFIPSLIQHFLDGRAFSMTAGGQARDLLYVDDLVEALVRAALVPGLGGEVVNVSWGREHVMRDVAQRVQRLMAVDLLVHAGAAPERPSEVRHLCADRQKATDVLGWEPRVSLPEGLARTVDWYRAQRTPLEAGLG